MKNRVLEIYALIVCGATLLISVAMFGTIFRQAIIMAVPSLRLTESQVRIYGNNDQYRLMMKDLVAEISEEEITRRRVEAKEVALQAAHQGAVREQLENGPIFVLFLFLSWVHWRLARKSSASQGAA